jgi:16S rRNA (cytidine1402-2'-O)-methyltransferase
MTDNAPAPGVLYLIATPIGNLEDITARALRLLREVALIAAEDTRVTRKLLAHFDIHTPLTSFHAHTGDAKQDQLLRRLLDGESIAVVSDAGTPLVSDPGAEFVAAAAREGIRVEPIPGPSAVLSALIASGLPTGRFAFDGFLPRTNDRRDRLKEVVSERRTVILFESSPRLVETLEDLRRLAGDNRRVTVARELTKKFEEFMRGTLVEVIAHYRATPPRGECVIVMEGSSETAGAEQPPDTDTLIRAALARGLSVKDASREVAAQTGLSRNEVYARTQQLREETNTL